MIISKGCVSNELSSQARPRADQVRTRACELLANSNESHPIHFGQDAWVDLNVRLCRERELRIDYQFNGLSKPRQHVTRNSLHQRVAI